MYPSWSSAGERCLGFDLLSKGGKLVIVGLLGGGAPWTLPLIPLRRPRSRAAMSAIRPTGLPPNKVELISFGQLAHDPDEVRLALEPNARKVGHDDVAALDVHSVRKAAIGLK